MNDLIHYFADLFAISHPGGIIVLELNVNDYSLTEIAQLVESNEAKILSLYIKSHTDSMKLELTLKINTSEITSILQTFERYNYNIKASYMEDESLDAMYESRYESFMKYLSI